MKDARVFCLGLAVVLLLQLAAVAWLLSNSYYFSEDFGQLLNYPREPLGPDLLSTSVFGHLIPGFVFAQWAAGGWLGASWTATALVTCVVQLGGTVAFARLLVALRGRRWWVPWLTGAFALGILGLNTVPWWAATLSPQIAVAASVSAMGCAMRYDRTRRVRHLVSLLVMFGVAVSFFEKSVIISAYVGLLVLIVGTHAPEEAWRERVHRAVRLWPVWAVFAAVSAVDLAFYFAGDYLGEAGRPAGARQTTEYLVRSLPEGVFPSLLGAAHPVTGLPGPAWLTPLAATTVAGSVALWTCLRSALARRAWVWFLLTAGLSQVLVARGRLSIQGTDAVVANLRYQVDPAYLFLVALTVALPAAMATVPAGRRARLALAAALVPLVALPMWIHTVRTLSAESPGAYSRLYLHQLRESTLPARTVFLDMAVPGYVVPPAMYPWNLASTVYPVARPGVEVGHDPRGASWIAPDGTIIPVELFDITAPADPGCLLASDGPVAVVAPPGPDLKGVTPPLLLSLRHTVRNPTSFVLSVGPSDGPQRGYGDDVRVRGDGELALPIELTATDAVHLRVTGSARLCLRDVRITRPAPPA